METITRKCDHCEVKAGNAYEFEGWLILKQQAFTGRNNGGLEPKLDRDFHFCSFGCLENWSSRANKILPQLRKEARNLSPRGKFQSKDFPDVYI